MSTVSSTSKVGHKPDPIRQDANDDGMKTALEHLMSEPSTTDKLRGGLATSDRLAGYSGGEQFGLAPPEQPFQMLRQVGPGENLGQTLNSRPASEPASDPTPAPSPSFDDDDRPTTQRPTVVTPPVIPDSDPGYVGPGLDDGPAPILDTNPDKDPDPGYVGPGLNDGPAPILDPVDTEVAPSGDDDGVGAGAADAVIIGGGFGALIGNFFRPLLSYLFPAAVSSPVGVAVVSLLIPNTAGQGSDLLPSHFQAHVDGDTGLLHVNGKPTDINLVANHFDSNGNPTAFGPATQEDAEALSNLTGTQINVGDPLGVIVNNDGVPGDGEDVEGAGETEAIDPVDEPLDLDNMTYGTGATFANPELLEGHFEEHGDDFGAETSEEYEEQADTFLTGPMSDSTLEIERPNGDIVRFDPETDEFGVVHADGNIGTYYAPGPADHEFETNEDYFYSQDDRIVLLPSKQELPFAEITLG